LFGRLGDRFGRVRALGIAVLTYSVFTGLSALSTHWTHLMVCRFCGAVGLGGTWGLCVALIVETWPERLRPLLAGSVGAAANFGFLLAATYSKIMRQHDYHWRSIIAVGAVMGLSSLPIILCVPEPTQWRQSRQKRERSSFADLFTREYRRGTIVGSLLSTVALLGTWGSFLWLSTYMDQIAEGTAYAKNAGSLVSQYSSIGQIAGGFLGGVIAGVLGNRKSWCVLCVGAFVSVFALFGLNTAFNTQAIVMAIIAGFFVTGFFGWLPKFLPELFPVRIRASGQGFAYNVGRILTGIGAIITGMLGYALDYRRGAMVMSSIYLLGLVIIWFAPDTRGKMIADAGDTEAAHADSLVEKGQGPGRA
jgi:MFS transporter, SHS family, sialic acid transporter